MDEEQQQAAEVTVDRPIDERFNETTSLWVDLYKPKKYWELLSDESTNRILLRWVKLWDKIVFNRRITAPKPKPSQNKFNKFQKQELITTLDDTGRPQHKVALLCGPPGLGKNNFCLLKILHLLYNISLYKIWQGKEGFFKYKIIVNYIKKTKLY